MLRNLKVVLACLIPALVAPTLCRAQEQPRLMAMMVQWRYPEAEIHGATMMDAATVNEEGVRTVPSIQCKTVMTTPAPIAKVLEHYRTKLTPTADSKSTSSEDKSEATSGRSVTFHEDSSNRPVKIHIIAVNEEKSSTTLVISRADAESETHIAWTRYMRF